MEDESGGGIGARRQGFALGGQKTSRKREWITPQLDSKKMMSFTRSNSPKAGVRELSSRVESIDSIVAAAALAGLIGGFEDQQRGEDAVAKADDGAVSYTHLTLPTIYSV